jgi:hypothetical protein
VETETELEVVWRASQNGSSKDACSSRRGAGPGVKTPKMTALVGQYNHLTTARIKLVSLSQYRNFCTEYHMEETILDNSNSLGTFTISPLILGFIYIQIS